MQEEKEQQKVPQDQPETTAAEKPQAAQAKPEKSAKGDKKRLAQLEAENRKLSEENAKLAEEAAAAKNMYYRAYADADNLKKRYKSEAEKADKYRIQSFALSILPSLDALERALAGRDPQDPFVKGIQMTYDSIWNALKAEGISEIDCLNKPFDADYCHAIMTEKQEGVEPGQVVEVLQKGYMLKDRLLRAALVKVSE